MSTFVSFADPIKSLLSTIVNSENLHTKWLNTLSYMENCGARKIAACQHPTQVREEMLKHASEEFRHAYYLKKQIERVSNYIPADYAFKDILGGINSLQYLPLLDLWSSRFLQQEIGLSKQATIEAAYLVVTYAIELRAAELYPIYEEHLRKTGSKVTVKSILLEEKEHLNEMIEGLHKLPSGFVYAERICAYEGLLCKKWLRAISSQI
jgi:hypothetical protein